MSYKHIPLTTKGGYDLLVVRWIVPGGPAAEMAEAAGIVQTSGHLSQWQVDHQQPRHLPSFFSLKEKMFSKTSFQ